MDAKTLGGKPVNATGPCQGITKRELFAINLMPAVIGAYIEANGRCLGTDHVAYNSAAHAVRLADALLAELAKDQP